MSESNNSYCPSRPNPHCPLKSGEGVCGLCGYDFTVKYLDREGAQSAWDEARSKGEGCKERRLVEEGVTIAGRSEAPAPDKGAAKTDVVRTEAEPQKQAQVEERPRIREPDAPVKETQEVHSAVSQQGTEGPAQPEREPPAATKRPQRRKWLYVGVGLLAAAAVVVLAPKVMAMIDPAWDMDFVAINGGCFDMGSPEGEVGRGSDERLHHVCVGDFLLGATEVTYAQYGRFADATGRRRYTVSYGPGTNYFNLGSMPADHMSWNDAVAYAKWLSEQTGKHYRLPTEAEWEYAARAGTSTPFSTGDCITRQQAAYNENRPYDGCGNVADVDNDDWHPIAAGTLEPNPWGLYDMHGNVYERTCSVYDLTYSGSELLCASDGEEGVRACRSGSSGDAADGVRSAARGRCPNDEFPLIGVRLLQEV